MKRLLGAAISALLLASVVAGSVSAANPNPKGTITTLSVNTTTCEFVVTITWQGFGGKVIPEVGLVRRTGTAFDEGIAYSSGPASSGKSGTYSHTFVLTAGTATDQYTAVGRLTTSRNPEISGSKSTPSGYVSGGSCGRPVVS
ncbi:MAG: hypothetical protein HYX54_07595 [Chloroflexi bacterium]|nr:hypothetical protein [Chloroflexota bacterium]